MSLTKFASVLVCLCATSVVQAKEKVINVFPEDKTKQVIVSENKLKVKPLREDDSDFLWGLFQISDKKENTLLTKGEGNQNVDHDLFLEAVETTESHDTPAVEIVSKIRMLPEYEYFEHKAIEDMSSRMYIDQESQQINFLVKKGYLKTSIKALMKDTLNAKSIVWRVGSHKVFGDYWVQGNSMEEVFNNMLRPYRKPNQVMGGLFKGNTIGVFYNNDQEFMQ